MAALRAFRADALPVTVRNTFIEDLADRARSPRPTARSSSMPPALDRAPPSRLGEAAAGSGSDDGWYSETEDDTEDRTTDVPDSRGAEESSSRDTDGGEGRSFPDTEDEWELGARPPPCPAAPAAPALGPGATGRHDEAEPDAPAQGPRSRRCRRCRGRMGDRCPCIARADALAVAAGTPRGRPALPSLPRQHAHAIAIRSLPADVREAPRAMAETTLKVFCAEGGGGIVVERAVRRGRRSSQSAPPPPDCGARGRPAAPRAGPGCTLPSSRACEGQSAAGDTTPTPTESTGAASPREEATALPAPSPPHGAPNFGFALLQYMRSVLQKNVFVVGVAISAGAAGGWCVRLGVHERDAYLQDHVLACAQEAIFDALDELEALRAGAPGGERRTFPETVFELKVECAGSSWVCC